MSELISTGGGQNHPAGCTCPFCTSTVHGEADVTLTEVPSQRTVASYASEVAELDQRFVDQPDVDGTLNAEVLDLGKRVLDASEADRPTYRYLAEAVEDLRVRLTDQDASDDEAEEVLFALHDITDANNMDVVEDGHGGHIRVADGKQGHTCVCGNGYATERVLMFHQTETGCGDGPAGEQDEVAELMGSPTPSGDFIYHMQTGDTAAVEATQQALRDLWKNGKEGRLDPDPGPDPVEPDVDNTMTGDEADERAGWHYPRM